jgi:hypothetical protein
VRPNYVLPKELKDIFQLDKFPIWKLPHGAGGIPLNGKI